jgi:hypothetical protein
MITARLRERLPSFAKSLRYLDVPHMVGDDGCARTHRSVGLCACANRQVVVNAATALNEFVAN